MSNVRKSYYEYTCFSSLCYFLSIWLPERTILILDGRSEVPRDSMSEPIFIHLSCKLLSWCLLKSISDISKCELCFWVSRSRKAENRSLSRKSSSSNLRYNWKLFENLPESGKLIDFISSWSNQRMENAFYHFFSLSLQLSFNSFCVNERLQSH